MAIQDFEAEGLVELLSPLSHGGDTDGTIRALRREKFLQPDGTYEQVPVYSGNAFRGQLRDCGVLYMLKRLGLDEGSLSPAAFYFLFSGGALTKEPGIGLDIDRARSIRGVIPLVGVFGGAIGRQTLHGKLSMGRMVPLAAETRNFIPRQYHELARRTVYDALQVLEYTRTDDAKNDHLADYLPARERGLLESPRVKVAPDGTEVAVGGAQQMRYGEETISTGAFLYHEWSLEAVTDVELQAFASCLYTFAKHPFLGGNSRIGHGKVALRYLDLLDFEPRQITDHELAAPVPLERGTAYDAHLDSRRDEIVAALEAIR